MNSQLLTIFLGINTKIQKERNPDIYNVIYQQNGKSERYIQTIEEGSQALLADAGLPMSFWLDAVLTRQYLVNRLPTSTLPTNLTPFEVITNGRKPDLSNLRVWGCVCYVAVPDELRPKAGSKRF